MDGRPRTWFMASNSYVHGYTWTYACVAGSEHCVVFTTDMYSCVQIFGSQPQCVTRVSSHSSLHEDSKRCDTQNKGQAIAQAVSCRLPTAAALVKWDLRWTKSAGAGFLRVLRFPLPIFIPPNSPSSKSPGASTIAQKWPTRLVDPVWTPRPTVRKKLGYKKGTKAGEK
jgi:hypothetical protein